MGFPHAICQVLLIRPPLSSSALTDLALDGTIVGLVSHKLLAIAVILSDHQDQLVAEADQRNPMVTKFPDLSCLEAAEMFVLDSSLLVDQLRDSTESVFNQLDKFIGDEEAFTRLSPDRTD